MSRTVAIGVQDFETIIVNNYFYVDKTEFIREWWESGDSVTLITRPRRFGKTLNMSMTEQFFSLEYAGRSDLFERLSVWEREEYRELQGTYPVIAVSFARVKENTYQKAYEKICQIITDLYIKYSFLRDSEALTDKDREYFDRISTDMRDSDATSALYQLSNYLYRHYGKKVIILLDEYDTPMQEAYVDGYWEELVSFTRSLFNSTFKTNPYIERGLMTGITRISHESMFSDLNNIKIVTTTTDKYMKSFGFTEGEVFAAMDTYGLSGQKENVKFWYDGFTFGSQSDIYNPWSIINFLDEKRFDTYWANTSSNRLVGKIIREASKDIKMIMEDLLRGKSFCTTIEEQIAFDQLDRNESAIWSLLLASGYLRVEERNMDVDRFKGDYTLKLTNHEIEYMFRNMIDGWFQNCASLYNDFIKALLIGDVDAMNEYMNRVALSIFSSFDAGNKPSEAVEPERFYHGFVLGLMVELNDRYTINSNRESGFGRYDVMLEPTKESDNAIILEFKVYNPRKEKSLTDTVRSALKQIEEKQYDTVLKDKGIPIEKIKKYGFAFEGKKVLIESGDTSMGIQG